MAFAAEMPDQLAVMPFGNFGAERRPGPNPICKRGNWLFSLSLKMLWLGITIQSWLPFGHAQRFRNSAVAATAFFRCNAFGCS